MDYSDQGFTKLKYTDVYLLLIQRGQFHLDSHTDLISTRLHLVSFHHWIRNSDGLVLKYSELFTSYWVISGLRDTYTHILYELLLTAECSTNDHIRCEYTSTFHLHVITVSPHPLIKRTINSYSTQRPTLDITIVLVTPPTRDFESRVMATAAYS